MTPSSLIHHPSSLPGRARHSVRAALAICCWLLAIPAAFAGTAVVTILDQQSNPVAGEKCVVTSYSVPAAQSGGVAVQWRNPFTTDGTGTFAISNCAAGKLQVRPVDANLAQFTFYMPPTNGTIYAQYTLTADAGNTLPPDTISYGVNASDLRYQAHSTNLDALSALSADNINANVATNIALTLSTNVYTYTDWTCLYVSGSTNAAVNAAPYKIHFDFYDNQNRHEIAWTNSNGFMIWLDGGGFGLFNYAGGFIMTGTVPDWAGGTNLYYIQGGSQLPLGIFNLTNQWNDASGSPVVYGGPNIFVAYGTNSVTNIVAVSTLTTTNSFITVDPVNGNDSTASIGGKPFKSLEFAISRDRGGSYWHLLPGTNNIFFPWFPTNATVHCEPGAVIVTSNMWYQFIIASYGNFYMDNVRLLQFPIGGNYGAPPLGDYNPDGPSQYQLENVTLFADYGGLQDGGAPYPRTYRLHGCNFTSGSYGIELLAGVGSVAYISDCVVNENAWMYTPSGNNGGNLTAIFIANGTKAFVTGCSINLSNSPGITNPPKGIVAASVASTKINVAGTVVNYTSPTGSSNCFALYAQAGKIATQGACFPLNLIGSDHGNFMTNYDFQGGSYVVSGSTNVTSATSVAIRFLNPFPTTNYSASFLSGGGSALGTPFASAKTTNGFTANFGLYSGNIDWTATFQNR